MKFIFYLLIVFTNAVYAIAENQVDATDRELAKLETAFDGRIGVFAMNTNNNHQIQYHANQHFPICSTAKVICVSAILKKSMTDKKLLQKKIIYTQNDLVSYSPITEKNLSEGMTIAELCAATLMYSDNSAMNILLRELGGPRKLTAFAHSIGNKNFRLDRCEPELNSAIPGDLRDTSTPAAMAISLQRLAFGDILGVSQRNQLLDWLKRNTTGSHRIRAGVPANWIVADKTGSGEYGTTNDLAIIWPPHKSPIILAIYFTQNKKDAKANDEVIVLATAALMKQSKTKVLFEAP